MHNVNLLYTISYYITVHIVRSKMFRRQGVIIRELGTKQLPDDDALTSKHVGAYYMYNYIIRYFI